MYVNALVAVLWAKPGSGYLVMLFSLFKRDQISGADQYIDTWSEITAGICRAYLIGWMIFWFDQFNSIDGI